MAWKCDSTSGEFAIDLIVLPSNLSLEFLRKIGTLQRALGLSGSKFLAHAGVDPR